MKETPSIGVIAFISASLVVATAGGALALTATTANDVCLPAADPCVITQLVEVAELAILDFGDRTLRIDGNGQLRFGAGSPIVRCGKLEVAVDAGHAALVVAAADGNSRAPTIETNAPDGGGTMDIDGDIEANFVYPERLMLIASGDIHLRRSVSLTSDETFTGELFLDSKGSVSLAAPIESDGRGGVIVFEADVDVRIDGPIQLNGNEEAGWLQVRAGRDAIVSSDIAVRTLHPSATYGTIDIKAGRDILLVAGADRPIEINASASNEDRGEAGEIVIDAGREIDISKHAFLVFRGDFALVFLSAGKGIDLNGSLLGGAGDLSDGPGIYLDSNGSFRLGPDGRIESEMREEAWQGEIEIIAREDLELLGSITTSGVGDEEIDGVVLEGCLVRFGSQARVRNSGISSSNRVTARHKVEAAAGAVVSSEHGKNIVRVRNASDVFLQEASFEPSATIRLASDLRPCERCGPGQSICDDGIPCTEEHCEAGECVRTLRDAACDDGNFCNGESLCTENGCVNGPAIDCSGMDEGCSRWSCSNSAQGCVERFADRVACDDQDACTIDDECFLEVCVGIRDVACGDCGNSTVDWGEDCDDGSSNGQPGSLCSPACQSLACGHPTGSAGREPTAADALFVLRAAVNQVTCPLLVCDVNGDQGISVADALLVLRAAVGQLQQFHC